MALLPDLENDENIYYDAYQFLSPMRTGNSAIQMENLIGYYQVFEPVHNLQEFCRIIRIIDGYIMNNSAKKEQPK